MLTAIICLSLCLGGCTFGAAKGKVSQEMIDLTANAQYLPSREMLVAGKDARSARAVPREISPQTLLGGGFTESEYDALIENISPIDTPFNREFTVSDAEEEVLRVLRAGVVYNKWFSYREGELAGEGKYYVTYGSGKLTVTRLSSFQPWVYDSKTNRFSDNDDIASGIPNYPIRSDNYLKISIYVEDGKQVVECEVAENLSYYNKVTPISYQIMRNVKDTSFTKIQVVMRDTVRNPQSSGGWGYDIDTDLRYGYIRNFTQLNYSGPNDIKWLHATQTLPYAFDPSARDNIEYGCRSADGGFCFKLDSVLSYGEFGYTPSEEYLTVTPAISYLNLSAKYADSYYGKNYWVEDGDKYSEDSAVLSAELRSVYNRQTASVIDSLISLAGESCGVAAFDCSAHDIVFESLFDVYFNSATKYAIDKSFLATNYLNNSVYEFAEDNLMPV